MILGWPSWQIQGKEDKKKKSKQYITVGSTNDSKEQSQTTTTDSKFKTTTDSKFKTRKKPQFK